MQRFSRTFSEAAVSASFSGNRLLLCRVLCQCFHVELATRTPRRARDMPEPGGTQDQRGVTVRECTDHLRSSPDLSHDPLEWLIGLGPAPVCFREPVVGQRLLDAALDQLSGLGLAWRPPGPPSPGPRDGPRRRGWP
jgi:hypothetical protein